MTHAAFVWTSIVHEIQVALPIVYYCHLDHKASILYATIHARCIEVLHANLIIQSSLKVLNLKSVINISSIDQTLLFKSILDSIESIHFIFLCKSLLSLQRK